MATQGLPEDIHVGDKPKSSSTIKDQSGSNQGQTIVILNSPPQSSEGETMFRQLRQGPNFWNRSPQRAVERNQGRDFELALDLQGQSPDNRLGQNSMGVTHIHHSFDQYDANADKLYHRTETDKEEKRKSSGPITPSPF